MYLTVSMPDTFLNRYTVFTGKKQQEAGISDRETCFLCRMCSDSKKNMSAFADQNHAPSLTCVRLELRWLSIYVSAAKITSTSVNTSSVFIQYLLSVSGRNNHQTIPTLALI